MCRSHSHGGLKSSGKKKDTGSTVAASDARAPSQLMISQTAILDAAETMRTLLPIGAAQKHTGRYLSFDHAGIEAWLYKLERQASLPPLPSWLRRGTIACAMYTVGLETVQGLQQLQQTLRSSLQRVQTQTANLVDLTNPKRLRDECELEPRGRIAKLVTEVRTLYGALLEEVACDLWQKWKRRIDQQVHQTAHQMAALQMEGAELLHASACAAVWTSTHASVLRLANYNSDDDACVFESAVAAKRGSGHATPAALGGGSSSLNLSAEVPLDWEPNLVVPVNQFSETNNSGAFSSQIPLGVCSKGSNVMQQLLARSINPASRGWSSSLQSALKKDLSVQSIVHDAFMIGLTGLHAAVEPTLRPKWQQRARIHTLLRPIMQQALVEDTRALAEVVKDVMRRSLAYDLHHELAARAAMASLQMQASQLTYPPEAMASTGLLQGMHNVVLIATKMIEHIYTSTYISTESRTSSLTSHFAQLCRNTLVSTWVGRVKTPIPRILVVDECTSLFMQGFQSRFVPFWIHSVHKGARAQRLDKDQYDGVHRHNAVMQMANSLDEAHTLHIQRRVLQHKSAALMTLDEAITFVTASVDDLLTSDDRAQIQAFRRTKLHQPTLVPTKASDTSTTLLLKLPSVMLAALLQFASTAWLGEQVKVVELGPRTRILHILVLANVQQMLRRSDSALVQGLMQNWNDLSALQSLRPQVDDLERRVRARPLQLWSVCACMECRRVANAMHQSDPKIVPKRASSNAKPTESRPKTGSSHEVGIVAAMNDLNDCSKLYCAKRPSAALKTALLSVNNATRMAVDRDENAEKTKKSRRADVLELDDETGLDFMQDVEAVEEEPDEEPVEELTEGSSTVQSSHSRMRRDTKRCYEQRRMAEACGTHAMLSIDCIGRAVQLMDQWYTICTFCGVVMRCTSGAQIGCHLACSMCHSQPQRSKGPTLSHSTHSTHSRHSTHSTQDEHADHALLGSILDDLSNESEKNNVQLSVGVRTASCLRERESDKTCRYCNSLCVRRGRGFVAYHSPNDRRGVNDQRPPALRITRWCPKHNRAWLKDALKIMPTNIVLAHIMMHAKPVNL